MRLPGYTYNDNTINENDLITINETQQIMVKLIYNIGENTFVCGYDTISGMVVYSANTFINNYYVYFNSKINLPVLPGSDT